MREKRGYMLYPPRVIIIRLHKAVLKPVVISGDDVMIINNKQKEEEERKYSIT